MTRERSLRPLEILLVEDSPDDVELTKEGLKEAAVAHNLNVVPDGVEAIDYLRRRGRYADVPDADLILLDLNLPRKDGREVLTEIKADEKLKHIPVIVFTTSQALLSRFSWVSIAPLDLPVVPEV